MDKRTSSDSVSFFAQCHCRSVSFSPQLRSPRSDEKLPISSPLCHCSSCRHSTGLLCTSYMPIARPPPSAFQNTTAFPPSPSASFPTSQSTCETRGVQRHFCSKCGCHVLRSRPRDSQDPEDEIDWEVATGILDDLSGFVSISRHINISDTKDGGLSIWSTEEDSHPLHHSPPAPAAPPPPLELHEPKPSTAPQADPAPDPNPNTNTNERTPPPNALLPAHCACNKVRFHITRPTPASALPHSPFPDLMLPYHSQDARIPNPGRATWWLRAPATTTTTPACPAGSRFLAGACACRSCRLTSGFEVQAWAFVPRCNIFFSFVGGVGVGVGVSGVSVPGTPDGGLVSGTGTGMGALHGEKEEVVPGGRGRVVALDFDAVRVWERAGEAVLRGYESSEGVVREFCPGCGATVFWHDRWRPEVVDVSVGLLDAEEGTRAEDWLQWWSARVSFEEDAAGRGDLVSTLGRGLRAWGAGEGGVRPGSRGQGEEGEEEGGEGG